jgi:4-hydroxy-tetrahydrodipicolinate synthase
MIQELNGSFVALVTPMEADGAIDYDSLERLIDWHINQGTNGIVSVGTTGESATISINEHIDLIEHTVKYVNKRIPVIAGTGANSTSEAIELTKESEKIGADFALIVTPYYNKPSQKGLIQHYTRIADCSNIPQILYNVPSRTSCDLMPETVNLLSKHKNIIGIKEAVSDKKRINDLIKISLDNVDFKILSGDDPSFYEFLKCGGHGVISVAANVIPESISNICSFTLNGDEVRAQTLNDRYINLYEMLFIESNPTPVKWMLYQMGLIQNSLRLPLIELDKKYHERISIEMLKLGLI